MPRSLLSGSSAPIRSAFTHFQAESQIERIASKTPVFQNSHSNIAPSNNKRLLFVQIPATSSALLVSTSLPVQYLRPSNFFFYRGIFPNSFLRHQNLITQELKILVRHRNLITRQLLVARASSNFDHARGKKLRVSSNFDHVRGKKLRVSSKFDHMRAKKHLASSKFDHRRRFEPLT